MNDKVDLKNVLKHVNAIPAQSFEDSTVDGTGANFSDCGSEILCVINFGAIATGAGGTVKLQQSANDATDDVFADSDAYTDITGAEHTFIDTADNTVVTFTTNLRNEKFIRATVTTTGGDTAVLGVTLHGVKHKF